MLYTYILPPLKAIALGFFSLMVDWTAVLADTDADLEILF